MENHGVDDVEAGPEDLSPQTCSDGPFPATASIPQNPDISNTNNAGVNLEAKPEAKPDARPPTTFATISRFGKSMARWTFLVATHIAIFPFIIFSICLTGNTEKLDDWLWEWLPEVWDIVDSWLPSLVSRKNRILSAQRTSDSSIRPKKPPVTKLKIRHLSIVTAIRLGCLLSVWLVVNLSVSSLKRVTLFGCLLWKWSLLSIVIILGYPYLLITNVLVRSLLVQFPKFTGSNLHYFIGGLEESVRLLIYFTWILVVWLLCIRTNNAALNRYGKLTLVSFLGGAVLSVVKSVALLRWKTKLIYKKYEGKILSAGCQLYFHLRIMNQRRLASPDLISWWDPEKQEKTEESATNSTGPETKETADNNGREIEKTGANNGRETKETTANNGPESREIADNNERETEGTGANNGLESNETIANNGPETMERTDNSERKSKNIAANNGRASRRKIPPLEQSMLDRGASLQHIDDVALYLTQNFELTLTEDDDMPDIAPILQKKFASDRQKFGIMTTVSDKTMLPEDGALLLRELLHLETSKKPPTYDQFEKWMVDGLHNCFSVGHRLNGAFEAMSILDKVLKALIVAVVILIWLFITGLATTKVVVALASLFLGLAFMFGETCKTFFQGVIFSFVTHPFDVGDRCIIDNKELEVKEINILTTTFFGNRKKEILLYPNSDLATKHIIKLRGEGEQPPDPEDLVELNLQSATKTSQIKRLQKEIEKLLDAGVESGEYKKPYEITVMDINGDSTKVSIHYEHNLDTEVVGDRKESLQLRKKKQRSKFLLEIRQILEDVSANQACSNTNKECAVPPMQDA